MGFFKDTPVENDDTKEYTYEVESDNVEEVLSGEAKANKVEKFDVSKAVELKAKESTKDKLDTLAKAEPIKPEAKSDSKDKEESVKTMELTDNDNLPVLTIPKGFMLNAKELTMTGNVLIEGDITCDNLTAKDIVIAVKSNNIKTINGDNIKVKGDGKVIANLTGNVSVIVDGAVKGQIKAPTVTLTDKAIVSGDILARHFNTSDKAKIKGAVRFTTDEATDIDGVFED